MAPLKSAVGITVSLVFCSTKIPGAWKGHFVSWGMLPLPESTLLKADGCGRVVHNLDAAMSSTDNFRLVVHVVLVMLIVAGLGDLEVSSSLFRVRDE